MSRLAVLCALAITVLLGLGATTAAAQPCSMPALSGKQIDPLAGQGDQSKSAFTQRRSRMESTDLRYEKIEYAAPIGTTVVAIEDGIVVTHGHHADHGNIVEIAHGQGTTSVYRHLSTIKVAADGQCIKKGDVIGQVGCTGVCEFPHLHFGMMRNEKAIGPTLKSLAPLRRSGVQLIRWCCLMPR
jgi:murein DD-endopeptidase MepM/ murein hydrolase activator NlpD